MPLALGDVDVDVDASDSGCDVEGRITRPSAANPVDVTTLDASVSDAMLDDVL